MVQCPQVAELPPAPAVAKGAKPEQRTYTDTLPMNLQQQNPTGYATYALELSNARGRSAGLSNQVEVPLAPTLPPPTEITTTVRAQEVTVNAITRPGNLHLPEGLKAEYHLYRRADGSTSQVDLGQEDLDAVTGRAFQRIFIDRTFEWEKTYFYRIAAITIASLPGRQPFEVPGEPSAEIKVFAHDIFPPAAPAGLQAVASGVGQPPFVDLTWAPNTEADLAGYHVYRHQAGQQPVKINSELVKAPAYRDREVTAGHNYFYAVTAVDLRGNESPRSAEAAESVP